MKATFNIYKDLQKQEIVMSYELELEGQELKEQITFCRQVWHEYYVEIVTIHFNGFYATTYQDEVLFTKKYKLFS